MCLSGADQSWRRGILENTFEMGLKYLLFQRWLTDKENKSPKRRPMIQVDALLQRGCNKIRWNLKLASTSVSSSGSYCHHQLLTH